MYAHFRHPSSNKCFARRCLQVDQLDLLADYVDAGNYARTCLYLTSTSAYLPEPDDHLVLVKARQQPPTWIGMVLNQSLAQTIERWGCFALSAEPLRVVRACWQRTRLRHSPLTTPEMECFGGDFHFQFPVECGSACCT